jgi:hypothetical protein
MLESAAGAGGSGPPLVDSKNITKRVVRQATIVTGDDCYWSSSQDVGYYAWAQRFSDGYQGVYLKYDGSCPGCEP